MQIANTALYCKNDVYSGIVVDLVSFAVCGGLCDLDSLIIEIVGVSDHRLKLKCNCVIQQDNIPKQSQVDI